MSPHASTTPRSPAALAAHYLEVLRRHWRLLLGSAIPIFALCALAVMLMPNVWEATTTIMVDPQQIPDKYVSTTVVDDPNERMNLLTQEVMSATRLGSVIDKLHLYPKLIARQGRDAAIEYMRAQIKIQTKHSSGSGPSAFTLTFQSSSAATAAATANELADSFIRKHLQARQAQVEGTTAFLDAELQQTRKDLEQQEEKISAYRMEHLGEMPEQMQANLQAAAELQVQMQANADRLNHLEEERIVLERSPEMAHDAGPAVSQRAQLLAQINTRQAQLADLGSRYTADHPDVIAAKAQLEALRAELRGLAPGAAQGGDAGTQVRLDLLTRERNRLVQEQGALAGRLAGYQAKVDAVPRRQEELSTLTRDYDSEKEHYRSLLDKTYSAQMATELEVKQQGERFQVLDRAQPPEKPISPNRPRYLAGAGVFALIAGFGLALLRESTDPSVKSQAELEALVASMAASAESLGSVSRMKEMRDLREFV